MLILTKDYGCAEVRSAWAKARIGVNGLTRGQTALNCGGGEPKARNNHKFSNLDICGDISSVKADIDDRVDKLNGLISALEDYESYVDCFEESISNAVSKIKGPKPWENLKADNLLQIVSLLGTKGLVDYEYEKKAGNLILTVNGEKVTLCAYGGDPINMSTGNYVYTGEFLSQKGLFPIVFNITYNSVDRNHVSLGVGFYSDIDMKMEIS